MFVNYHHTVTTVDTPVELFTVAAGKSMLVLDIAVAAGTNAGKLTLIANDGTSDVFAWAVDLSTGDNADLSPQKIRIFGEGYKLSVKGSALGLSCYLSAVEK